MVYCILRESVALDQIQTHLVVFIEDGYTLSECPNPKFTLFISQYTMYHSVGQLILNLLPTDEVTIVVFIDSLICPYENILSIFKEAVHIQSIAAFYSLYLICFWIKQHHSIHISS